MREISPRVVFSFHILSFFVAPNFARIPRLNHPTDFYAVCFIWRPGYCINRGIKIQKLPIFPIFTPKTAQKWAWIGIFRPNVQSIQIVVFSKPLMWLHQIWHSDKDHQILVVGRPKNAQQI